MKFYKIKMLINLIVMYDKKKNKTKEKNYYDRMNE